MDALINRFNLALRWRVLIVLGLGLGLPGLVAIWLWSPPLSHPGAVVRPIPEMNASTGAPSAPAPGATLSPAMGQCWKALADGNYRRALAELRAGGIPEPVIADILFGAATRRYGPGLLALRRAPWRFWEPVQRRQSEASEVEAQREMQAREIEAERNALMRDLLGMDWASFQSNVSGRPDPLDRVIEGFSPGARSNSREILARFDALERDVIQRAGGTLGQPERAELNRLYASKIEQLRLILSPQELEEYEIRTSVAAENLRQIGLVGFDPTEEEFRTIYRLRSGLESQPFAPAADRTDTESRFPIWQAHDEMLEELHTALGDERYSDYCRSQDYTFRGLIELTEQFDLPKSTAVQVHDLRESFLRNLRAIGERAAPSAEERKASFDRLYRNARDSVKTLLGDPAYRRYTQLDIAGWMTQPPPP